ncbi:MAG: rhomboid family intramembrane serine protease [Bacteroidetes bacterium]|nr:MAG: rhomboid family intramembrane serine protease [Bacteroidota bacterium]
MGITDDIKNSFRQGSTLTRLIYLNLGLFLAVQIVRMVLFMSNSNGLFESFIRLLAVPADKALLIRRPWTLITYMFLHVDFIHILFNLLWLYWFGRVFMQEMGQKKLLSTYLIGGISGGLLYGLFYNNFAVFSNVLPVSYAMGASASVMAIVIATATYRPNMELHLVLIGRVKIIYIALAMFILTTLVDFSVNTGGKIAHIGGALAGFIIAYYSRKGRDITKGFDRIMDQIATWVKPRPRDMKVSYKRPADDIEYNKVKAEEQQEIDRILDKISKAGYDSLSAREKEILFKMSNKK